MRRFFGGRSDKVDISPAASDVPKYIWENGQRVLNPAHPDYKKFQEEIRREQDASTYGGGSRPDYLPGSLHQASAPDPAYLAAISLPSVQDGEIAQNVVKFSVNSVGDFYFIFGDKNLSSQLLQKLQEAGFRINRGALHEIGFRKDKNPNADAFKIEGISTRNIKDLSFENAKQAQLFFSLLSADAKFAGLRVEGETLVFPQKYNFEWTLPNGVVDIDLTTAAVEQFLQQGQQKYSAPVAAGYQPYMPSAAAAAAGPARRSLPRQPQPRISDVNYRTASVEIGCSGTRDTSMQILFENNQDYQDMLEYYGDKFEKAGFSFINRRPNFFITNLFAEIRSFQGARGEILAGSGFNFDSREKARKFMEIIGLNESEKVNLVNGRDGKCFLLFQDCIFGNYKLPGTDIEMSPNDSSQIKHFSFKLKVDERDLQAQAASAYQTQPPAAARGAASASYDPTRVASLNATSRGNYAYQPPIVPMTPRAAAVDSAPASSYTYQPQLPAAARDMSFTPYDPKASSQIRPVAPVTTNPFTIPSSSLQRPSARQASAVQMTFKWVGDRKGSLQIAVSDSAKARELAGKYEVIGAQLNGNSIIIPNTNGEQYSFGCYVARDRQDQIDRICLKFPEESSLQNFMQDFGINASHRQERPGVPENIYFKPEVLNHKGGELKTSAAPQAATRGAWM